MARSIICACEFCGKKFNRSPYQVRDGRAKHCSRKCADEHKKADYLKRFWDRIQKSGDGCWTWHGTLDKNGYGLTRKGGVAVYAHRLSYEIHHGEIQPNQIVRHSCDNPPCVNPNHLETGSQIDNVRDRDLRQRTARGDRSGTRIVSSETVRQIRRDYAVDHSLKRLVATYGISRNTIQAIVYMKTWKHMS